MRKYSTPKVDFVTMSSMEPIASGCGTVNVWTAVNDRFTPPNSFTSPSCYWSNENSYNVTNSL